jgi:hypothetical protein
MFAVTRVKAQKPCRVRLYANETAAYFDRNRPTTEPPQAGIPHGVILDLLLNESTGLDFTMSPLAFCFDDPRTLPLVVEPPCIVRINAA